MTKQMLIYQRATPVSSERHRDLSVRSGRDYAFSREVNSVPLVISEIPLAAAEYPIVFAGGDEAVLPAAVFGTREAENVFVGEDGTWTGDYVPAFMRRYPFVFAEVADGNLALCVDEEFEGLNREGRGERLFDADGNRTQYLENVLAFMRQYQAEIEATRRFTRGLRELDLLESAHATFRLTDGRSSALQGFKMVSRTGLKALPPETLAELAASDALELCYLHLHSLARLRGVASRSTTPPPETAGEAGTAEAEPEAV